MKRFGQRVVSRRPPRPALRQSKLPRHYTAGCAAPRCAELANRGAHSPRRSSREARTPASPPRRIRIPRTGRRLLRPETLPTSRPSSRPPRPPRRSMTSATSRSPQIALPAEETTELPTNLPTCQTLPSKAASPIASAPWAGRRAPTAAVPMRGYLPRWSSVQLLAYVV